MNGRFLLASAAKDVRRRASDPAAFVLWLGIPLMLGVMLSLANGSSSDAGARGVVLLADQDNQMIGRIIENGLQQGALGSLFQVQRASVDAARERLEAGDATALIVVPKGATDAFLDDRPVALSLVKNPAQRILPSIVEDAMDILVEAGYYGQRLFGEPLRDLNGRLGDSSDFPTNETVASFATLVNDRLRRVRTILLPPVLQLEVEDASLRPSSAEQFSEFGRLFLPGLLFLSLLFIAQGMSGDVWTEHVHGTLRRALAAPHGVLPFLLGKVLAAAALIAAVSIVGLATGVVLFGIPVLRALLAFPWTIFGGTILVMLFLIPQVLAGSQRGASMLGSMLVFPLMMIGGSFFPFEAMPAWMAAVGRWTPNGQAVARLKDVLNGTPELSAFLSAIVAMSLPAALAVWFASRRIRSRFSGAA